MISDVNSSLNNNDSSEAAPYIENTSRQQSVNLSAKGRKRGNSFGRFINKMIGGNNKNDEEISTEHGFELKTQNKTFTLFTFNQEEAETWVRVL